jgi:hypothetical protein
MTDSTPATLPKDLDMNATKVSLESTTMTSKNSKLTLISIKPISKHTLLTIPIEMLEKIALSMDPKDPQLRLASYELAKRAFIAFADKFMAHLTLIHSKKDYCGSCKKCYAQKKIQGLKQRPDFVAHVKAVIIEFNTMKSKLSPQEIISMSLESLKTYARSASRVAGGWSTLRSMSAVFSPNWSPTSAFLSLGTIRNAGCG